MQNMKADGSGVGSGKKALFISDVHSNIDALQSVLAEVGDLPIFCLGDVVGYGASPNEVVDILRERHATCVLGNHDNAAVTGDVRRFNRWAAVAAAWTSRNLTYENKLFLELLPRERTIALGEFMVYMTHGSPDDNLWEYVSDDSHSDVFDRYFQMLKVDIIALGHTHVPFIWSENRRIVFNPGSVGQPRGGDSRASYALLTVDGPTASVEHGAVEYDVASAARKILDAELPSELAERLFVGE